MRLMGFSTGALAYSDFRTALRMLREEKLEAVELSALRMVEWKPLLTSIDNLDLDFFEYVSIHLPSAMTKDEERMVAKSLEGWDDQRDWPLILHPDAITDWGLWRDLGASISIENMDTRKLKGRTERELNIVFRELPKSRLCFDVGHAWQVDPTMGEAYWILKLFGEKLTQVHVSEVNSSSKHDTLSYSTIESFREIAHMIPSDIPLILETPVSEEQMQNEVNKARFALTPIRTTALQSEEVSLG